MIVLIAVISFVFWIAQAKGHDRAREAFRVAAFNHDGTVDFGDSSGRPSVHFKHGSVQVLLDIYSTRGEEGGLYTQLHLGWSDKELRLEVFPDTGLQSLGRLLGAQDITIGSDVFDQDYIIRGNDEQQIAELLTADIQARINQLRSLLGNNDIYIGTKAGTLLIKKRSCICDAEQLEQFISLGLAFYDTFIGVGVEGVEFIGSQESSFAINASQAICQICGEAITSSTVFCRSCKTPHHQDCWAYYGKCSTYGCGELRYTTPRG